VGWAVVVSGLGRRQRHGCYEVTFLMDADDCDNLAACLPSNDTFATELHALADEIRTLEAERHDGPTLAVVLEDRAGNRFTVTP
jgi:hypothetical protein